MGAGPQGEAPVNTLIFVDIDGVLNIGIQDPGRKPVEFSSVNVDRALQMKGASDDAVVDEVVEKVLATYHRQVEHEGSSTYAEYTASASLGASEKMVGRLAQIIEAAGDHCTVVLTSSWRHPRHSQAVARLETALAACLGKKFMFHDRTAHVHDNTPEKRLRTIGDFVASRGRRLLRSSRKLRVLVLEDFHVSALDGWPCDGVAIDSAGAAEGYLLSRLPTTGDVSVQLVHTFASWTAPSGLSVRMGTGLTGDHFGRAMEFLGHLCSHSRL